MAILKAFLGRISRWWTEPRYWADARERDAFERQMDVQRGAAACGYYHHVR